MRIKKIYIYITASISLISFVILVILQFRLYTGMYQEIYKIVGSKELMVNIKELGITVFGGVFTGAILTFFLSIADYFIERRNAFEEIFSVSEELQKRFSEIRFFLPEEPKELVKGVLEEINQNKFAEEINQMFSNTIEYTKDENHKQQFATMYMTKSYENQEKFKEYLWKRTNDAEKSSYDKERYLERMFTEKINQYNNKIEEAMKSYLKLRDISTNSLSSAYGKIDFLFSNNTKRKYIYDNLYLKQYNTVNKIKAFLFHFDKYFQGKDGNLSVMFDYLCLLQKELVSEDQDMYYRQYSYDIDNAMRQVLTWTYGKKNNKDELPEKKHYIIQTKPEWYQRMLKKNN